MSCRDIYHNIVVRILIEDGWIITDDPLVLTFGGRELYADLGAERRIGAERNGVKIGVEIKTFIGQSDVHDLELALGQYNIYRDILKKTEPDRQLYLAVPQRAYEGIFIEPLGQLIVKSQQLLLLVYNEEKEELVEWIPLPTTNK
jgi:hypothetical protein